MMIRMATTSRSQQRYDHRLRALVQRTGDVTVATVYRADDLRVGQPVALKFLSPVLARDQARLARFIGEVRLARQISHPNVCRVYDLGERQGQPYLSMEYIDGEDLSSLLRRVGRLSPERRWTSRTNCVPVCPRCMTRTCCTWPTTTTRRQTSLHSFLARFSPSAIES